VLAFTSLGLSLAAQSSQPSRFESEVQPLFRSKCLTCHSVKTRQAGLSLESRDDLLKGGKSGPAIVPGKSADSLLLAMIMSGKMPMGGPRLESAEIETIRRWIDEDKSPAAGPMVSESDVQTILAAKCWVCHGRRAQQAGLDLRTRESILKGGKSGAAIVPGKPDQSLLMKRISAQEMPPPKLQEQYSVRGLTSDELEKVRQWIAEGARAENEQALAVEARSDPMIKDKDREFWAFRPPQKPAVPQVRNSGQVRNPIDAFVLDKLESKGLSLSPEASRLALLRRAYFDLIGLPPSPEEAEAWLRDPDPKAYEHLIDRLLESPRYGERWARYWLDAVGYADSEGGSSADEPRPHAWRYRDYVIRSLNANKPYDRFLTEQIAGDELFDYKAAKEYTPEQVDLLAATGFWRLAPDSTYSTEQNFILDRMDVIAAQLEILGSSVMGLSIGCARCHDHKYDPIPQRDYYRLVAVLAPAYDPFTWLAPNMHCGGVGAHCDDNNTRYLPLLVPGEREKVEAHNVPLKKKIAELEKLIESTGRPYRQKLEAERLASIPEQVREDVRKALATPATERTEVQSFLLKRFEKVVSIEDKDLMLAFEEYRKGTEEVRKELAEEKAKLLPDPKIRALFDLGPQPPPSRILLRGEPTTAGALVAPGAPSIVGAAITPYEIPKLSYASHTSGRRLALARWLVQPDHPLTARVMVNRIWQHHFGAGLVNSAGNFGRMGTAPSNQQLLDWLSTEFVRQGWDIKAMHRLIMTSAVYRQTSRADASRLENDPDNTLLSRSPLRRLDSDTLRDSILKLAGRLDLTPFGPAQPVKLLPDGEVIGEEGKTGERRSIYLMARRTRPLTLLDRFDTPFMNPNCVRRAQSTVSSQALELMNSDLARQVSRRMAGRIIDIAGDDVRAQCERLYWLALTRAPTAAEVAAMQSTLAAMEREWLKTAQTDGSEEPVKTKAHWLALATLCHTILNSAEFLYVD
jgi:mono/diheme cytochrome c family protein